MPSFQSDLKAHRDLWERLQSLIVAPDRTAWRDFCQIDPQKPEAGCAKYRQCPKHIRRLDERCWDREPPSVRLLPVVYPEPEVWKKLGRTAWCGHFDPLRAKPVQIEPRVMGENTGELKRKNILDKPVAAYSFGIICEVCENTHEGRELSGLYRQCATPCPFTGCAVPRLLIESASSQESAAKSRQIEHSEKEQEKEEPRPPLGCPYNPRTAKGGIGKDFLSNTYARVQCFITRDEFLRYQTEVLGLHMGFFAFTGIRDESKFVYLARDPYKEIQITQMMYDPSCGWMPDRHEHRKSYLFQASRELGRPVAGEHDLLTRLRGTAASFGTPSDEARGWRGLTQFDRANQVLYVSDGEMSAFCLRWLLEEAENLWGTDGLRNENGIDLSGLALTSRERTREDLKKDLSEGMEPNDPSWYPRRNPQAPSASVPEKDPHGWRVEDYLIDRFLVGQERDLNALKSKAETIRSHDTGAAPILEYMGFDDSVAGLALLVDLGIVVRVNSEEYVLGTERFWRLVRYLQRYHLPKELELAEDAAFAQGLFRLIYLTAEAIKSGRIPKAKLTYLDCGFLLKWIAVAPNLEAHKAPITRDGCPGHIMLRRSFLNTTTKPVQVETCSRSWIAFPVFAYEPYHRRDKLNAESKQVGFFLGTIDDGECYENDGVLDASLLSEKLFKVKQWMTLIASVEAAGTYFEDIVAKAEINEGIDRGTKQERKAWVDSIRKSDSLGSVLNSDEEDSRATDVVKRLAGLVDRRTDFIPLPLRLSYLFETSEMHFLTHGVEGSSVELKSYENGQTCLADIKKAADCVSSLLEEIRIDARLAAGGAEILNWDFEFDVSDSETFSGNFIKELQKQLDAITSINDEDFELICEVGADQRWRIKPFDALSSLAVIQVAFREAVRPARESCPLARVREDCIFPFESVYDRQIKRFIQRIMDKQQNRPPRRFEFYLEATGGDLSEDFQDCTIRQLAYVFCQENKDPNTAPGEVIGRVIGSNTGGYLTPIMDVVNIYVAVRALGQLVIKPFQRSGNFGMQNNLITTFADQDEAQEEGVYWILVLSWLKKR
jgi:hypothetical protein